MDILETLIFIEDRIVDDAKFPVVENNKIKICCKYSLEILKLVIYNVKHYIDATKKEKAVNLRKKPIPEDYELSDDEPKMVNLSKEQKLKSKDIVFECPLCQGKLQLRNEIEINPKGITCRCNPCSFKLTKNDKTMNVSKDDEGGITLDSQDHSISFAFNRIIYSSNRR